MSGVERRAYQVDREEKGFVEGGSKVDNLVSRASDELRTAERALADMMDKVIFA